jgi:hypothetical protein
VSEWGSEEVSEREWEWERKRRSKKIKLPDSFNCKDEQCGGSAWVREWVTRGAELPDVTV